MRAHYLTFLGFCCVFVAITATAFYLASYVSDSLRLQDLVQDLGFVGLIVTAFLATLNFVVPIHPATFAPIFLEAGDSYLLIAAGFAIGATLADCLSYFIGSLGRSFTEDRHPVVTAKVSAFIENHHYWILPGAYLYMTFAPTPNEYIIFPLALAGFRFKHLIIPMLIGNFIHHYYMAYGYTSVFQWFFG